MKIQKRGSMYDMTLSADELDLIIASLREARESIEDWEYHTRLGFEKSEATVLLHAILDASNKLTGS